MPSEHFVIPDAQVKPGVPTDHLRAAGNYIVAKKPDVVICLGDFWDMPSLSSYDKGKKSYEGRRYKADIEAGRQGMQQLLGPLMAYNKRRRQNKKQQYLPRLVFLLGNHEQRIERVIESDPILEGTIGYQDFKLEELGWEVHDFREPVEIDGIVYSHYFYNPNSGNPWGGKCSTKLNNIGFTFTMGHQQGLDIAMKHLANGTTLRGLVAGSFYQHEENYKGPQANNHFQGCIYKHEVKDGNYNLMELSLDYLMENWL